MSTSDNHRTLLRHTVATIGYRCAKAIRDAPAGFATFKAAEATRTPVRIVSHMSDVLDWGTSLAKGRPEFHVSEPAAWDRETARFFAALQYLDDLLASDSELGCPAERLFQGPIADVLTHVGQLAMLRRMAGAPVRGENYYKADIVTGQVGTDQAPPKFEFD